MNYKKWIKLNTCDLKDKTTLITGSTGGLGKEICKLLVSLNCNLILLNRNLEKSKQQKAELLKINPSVNIEIFQVDLANINQVKETVNSLKSFKLDYILHNAGVYNVPINTTPCGYNNVFTINFISPYYLTKELFENIQLNNTKVVVVSSIAHNYSTINETDFDFSKNKKPSKIYGNSKRFLIFSMIELFKKHNLSNLSICHPGITLTNMTNHYPKAVNWFVKVGIKLLFPNTQMACFNIIKAMFEATNHFEWIGPKYFNIWGKPKKKTLTTCSSQESQKIFEIAENIYKKIKQQDNL